MLGAANTGGPDTVVTTASGTIDFQNYARYDNHAAIPSPLPIGSGSWDGHNNQLGGRSTGNTNFNTVLDSELDRQGQGDGSMAITLYNLVLGHTYEVLVLNVNNTGTLQTMQASDANAAGTPSGNVSAIQQYNFTTGAIGGYIEGTFTADATTQTLYMYTPQNRGQTNAIVLSEVVVPITPEPASLSLLALGGLGLLARRRR